MLSFSDICARALLEALKGQIDAGSGGIVRLYAGPVATFGSPINDATNPTLATFKLPKPCGTALAKTLTLAAIPDAQAVAVGTATFFRIGSGESTTVLQGSVTPPGGGGDMEINTLDTTVGLAIKILSATVTLP